MTVQRLQNSSSPEHSEGSYDVVILSPHLDDAALSCGASIYQWSRQGLAVLVVTLATAQPEGKLSPLAEDLHRRWGLTQKTLDIRRQEDLEACQVLGAKTLHLDLLDALYRRTSSPPNTPLYPTLKSLFGPIHGEDQPQIARLKICLAPFVAPFEAQRCRVLAPLAAGHHVDHVLTRRVAESTFGPRLEFYEDYPYSLRRWVLAKAVGWPWRWRKTIHPVDQTTLEAKCRAIACYRSQLGTAFKDLTDMRRQMERFTQRSGGERLRRRRAP